MQEQSRLPECLRAEHVELHSRQQCGSINQLTRQTDSVHRWAAGAQRASNVTQAARWSDGSRISDTVVTQRVTLLLLINRDASVQQFIPHFLQKIYSDEQISFEVDFSRWSNLDSHCACLRLTKEQQQGWRQQQKQLSGCLAVCTNVAPTQMSSSLASQCLIYGITKSNQVFLLWIQVKFWTLPLSLSLRFVPHRTALHTVSTSVPRSKQLQIRSAVESVAIVTRVGTKIHSGLFETAHMLEGRRGH